MPCTKCKNGKYKFGEGDCKYPTLEACEKANQTYDIVELVIDENNEELAIDAISLVTSPAIETDFVYFNKDTNLNLAAIDEEKRLLVSPALIPYKQIYRYDAEKDKDYYVYFTAETVRKSAEAYMKHQNTNNATIQHEDKVTGVHTVESWIVEDSQNDKSNLYNFELPKGTWFVTMRVLNDEVWERIKSGELKGLSIEGYFVDKMQTLAKEDDKKKKYAEPVGEVNGLPLYVKESDAKEAAKELGCDGTHEHNIDGDTFYMPCSNHEIVESLMELIDDLEANDVCTNLASYNNYPKGASANAERAIIENEERGNKCATQTGKVRAQQLAARKNISSRTVSRVYSYLSRAKTYDTGNYDDCGTISYNLWGGDIMRRWAEKILKSENETK
tara:strand:- start:4531 stop:5694 length:1164 start_codon:yes stop_codon:yes gene_type:complete